MSKDAVRVQGRRKNSPRPPRRPVSSSGRLAHARSCWSAWSRSASSAGRFNSPSVRGPAAEAAARRSGSGWRSDATPGISTTTPAPSTPPSRPASSRRPTPTRSHARQPVRRAPDGSCPRASARRTAPTRSKGRARPGLTRRPRRTDTAPSGAVSSFPGGSRSDAGDRSAADSRRTYGPTRSHYHRAMPVMKGGDRGPAAAFWRNRALRRVLPAYLVFNAAEFGTWVAILLYAYERTGPGVGRAGGPRSSSYRPRCVAPAAASHRAIASRANGCWSPATSSRSIAMLATAAAMLAAPPVAVVYARGGRGQLDGGDPADAIGAAAVPRRGPG